jgi:hypothetical protein
MTEYLLAIFTLLTISNRAQARFFVEPYVGYTVDSGRVEALSTSSQVSLTSKGNSTEAGLRLGARAGWFWLAFDPSYASGSQTVTLTGSSTDISATQTQSSLYGDIGFDFSSGWRFWGGAPVYNEMKIKGTASTLTVSNNGWKAGIGWRFYHAFCLNLEYRLENPTQLNDSVAGDIDIKANYSKYELSRTLLSISYLW